MASRLRDLIRQVRACQTAAEERTVIQKECALIRTDFKENKEQRRARNIMKLMYIHMLGYSTEFGQVECVKLLAQNDYVSKRVGYLTIGILLDESQEVLTLIQNHTKRDLSHSNQFVQALALSTIANISSEDMARDVGLEVAQLIDNPNAYLRKKAILAGLRVIRKVPEFMEHYADRISSAITDRNHGVMVSGLAFACETMLLEDTKPFLDTYVRVIPQMIKALKALLMSSYATEHDVSGIADPFIQVKILRFFRYLAIAQPSVIPSINDILAQMATNTDGTKNAGSAILYECAQTITNTDCDSGLKPLGVNILARFLTNKDNNYRYVALNALLHVVQSDPDAVQKHRSTIIECLKDSDPSIRKRALELVVAFVSAENVSVLVPDLIIYLSVCNKDFRENLAGKLCTVIQRHAPNDEWRAENILRVITTAGSCLLDSTTHQFIALITQCDVAVRRNITQKLWDEVAKELDGPHLGNEALLTSVAWLIGEFGDELPAAKQGGQFSEMLVSKLSEIASMTKSSPVRQYCLTGIMKIASRDPSARFLATQVLETYIHHNDLEVQQRACEFHCLLKEHETIAEKTMAKMPTMEYAPAKVELSNVPSTFAGGGTSMTATPVNSGGGNGVTPPPPAPPARDVLDDIFGSIPSTAAPPPQQQQQQQQQPSSQNTDFFGGAGGSLGAAAVSQSPPATVATTTFEGFRNNDLSVEFTAQRMDRSVLSVEAIVNPFVPLQGVSLLVAVPRTASIDLQPLSSSSASPGGAPIKQKMVVNTNTSGDGEQKPLTLKVKVEYNGAEQVFTVKRMIS